MRNAFQSATLKLTAYYMAIILAICLIFSAAIYHFANSELREGLYRQSQRIVNEYPGFDFNAALRSERDFREGSHRILLNLIYFNVFVLVLTGVGSYELARRTLRPIEESHEQQKRFTSDVSHELRTPLTALRMSTEVALLDDKATKPALREALTDNLEEVGKLEDLINNLLRLTRLEALEIRHSFTPVDMSKLMQESVANLQKTLSVRKLQTDVTLPKELTVTGDPASLKQLVSIVLDNAVKYSREHGGIQIEGSGHDGFIRLIVQDEGIGIAPEDLPHIFERFYRADAARTRHETSGYGLGLSIAKMIADIHDGTIHISSAAGHGTKVQIDLPLQHT
jgi:two-component system sensor histidine kinase CiaH